MDYGLVLCRQALFASLPRSNKKPVLTLCGEKGETRAGLRQVQDSSGLVIQTRRPRARGRLAALRAASGARSQTRGFKISETTGSQCQAQPMLSKAPSERFRLDSITTATGVW